MAEEKTNDYRALQQLFVSAGSHVDPETELLWRTWEKQVPHQDSIMNEIRHTTADFVRSQDPNKRRECFSPLYNRIIYIFQKMEFVVKYFAGEFEIQCKDKYFREQFANIWHEFIRGWYFGSIYVGYGDDFKKIDDLKLKKDGLDPGLEGIPGRFRLFTRTPRGEFYSVFSKLSGIKFRDHQLKRLVKCECTGINNWIFWWYLWNEWKDGMERFHDSIKWLSKQAVLTPKSIAESENILKQGDNNEPFIIRSSSSPGSEDSTGAGSPLGKTKFDEIEVTSLDTPLKIFECYNRYFEFEAAQLGYAGKVQEQKKERINAGENFPHQKVVSNMRTFLLNSLNLCFDRMRAKFGEKVVPPDLKIVATNQSFAQGLPDKQFGGTFNAGDGYREWQAKANFTQQQDKIRGND